MSVPTITQTTATGDEKLECSLCASIAWKGPLCEECPLYQKYHYTEGLGSDGKPADFFIVAESPHIFGPSGSTDNHIGWQHDTELLIYKSVIRHKEHSEKYRALGGRYTYAVRCAHDKPTKRMGECCSSLFHLELKRFSYPDRPLMVFALGPAVLRSLNIKYGKYQDVQGKFIETKVFGRRVFVFPTLSKRQLASKAGYVEVMRAQLKIFLDGVCVNAAGGVVQTEVSMEQIIEKYEFPQTPTEVTELVDYIVNYAPPGGSVEHAMLAIDTETNTLFPHRPKLKMLSLVAAWDVGAACSIPFEHPQTPWDPKEVHAAIAKLLTCVKPKVGHNIKYDLKVLEKKGFRVRRVSWDTMLGEHLIEEDKKGYYSLKNITKLMLPKYAGYEDQLHDILNMLEAPTLLRQIKQEDANVEIVIPKAKLKGAAKKLANDQGFMSIPLKELNEYGAIDGDVTRQLAGLQLRRIKQENKKLNARRRELLRSNNTSLMSVAKPGNLDANPLLQLMITRSIPATKALARMEAYGMRVDRDYVEDLLTDMDQSLRVSRQELNLMIPPGIKFKGKPFNPESAPNIRTVLFGTGYIHPKTKELVCYKGVVEPPRTATDLPSTNQAFLRSLVTLYNCEFTKSILKFRATSKARNTFVANVHTLSAEDGRMHTSFHIAGTATGRLSSSDENMQNVPSSIGEHNLKKMFIPSHPETQIIVNADAKAAEVRLYAAYSKDPNLIKALNEGMDPHSFFASMVYNPETILQGINPEDHPTILETVGIDAVHAWNYADFQGRDSFYKTDKGYSKKLNSLRKTIKRVVFGILYGASERKISYIVGIPPDQAAVIIKSLHRMFPAIATYIKHAQDQVRLLDVVETFLGRRRRFDYKGLTFAMQHKAKRQAVNFKIQSTSSDIVLGVLCDMLAPLEMDLKGRMLITVHDSVVFEIDKKYASQMPDFIHEYGVKRVAEQYPWMPVPFQWDVDIGPSYGELMSVESYLEANAEYRTTDVDECDELDIRSEFSNLGT